MSTRRHFLRSSGAALLAAGLVSRLQAASLPEAPIQTSPLTQPPLLPPDGRPYHPVVTLNGWTLPWRMNNGVKEFHLIAEPVVRELAPGMKANLWGYNGQSPGPTIEVVEGDRVRLFVTNKLPEHTTIHWHGQRLPNGMDGVGGLTQPHIKPGQTYVYEFEAKRAGTFMYHPHADEMFQMAMGLMGSWVTHPKSPDLHRVDRDFIFLLNAYDIDPGTFTPKTSTMLNFNLWNFNSRVFPGIDAMVARKGDRVRIRIGNLTMTNHPIHVHGHEIEVAGTDGGWLPQSARWPEVSVDIGVGQMRAIEFDATEEGDWAFHCHKSHHTMNAMGHNVPTMMGVDQRNIAQKITRLVPDYMVMGDSGGAMGEMQMALPNNTLPMMTGTGPFGPMEMGGMFTTVKIRAGLARDDYRDPGWYKHPDGTVAREWGGPLPASQGAPADQSQTAASGTFTVTRSGRHEH
jgi:FtsP/CotA-like multicopper oxidase with cupredoxin domain